MEQRCTNHSSQVMPLFGIQLHNSCYRSYKSVYSVWILGDSNCHIWSKFLFREDITVLSCWTLLSTASRGLWAPGFVYLSVHVCKASAIMVPHKCMHVQGYSICTCVTHMCTAPATCAMHAILNTPMHHSNIIMSLCSLCSTSDPRLPHLFACSIMQSCKTRQDTRLYPN